MKNLVTSMKALGAKMTGKDIAGKDLVQVVDNIAENYEGGGSGGGGIVFVELETNEASMTVGEIYEAVNNGSYVIGRGSNNPFFYPLSLASSVSATFFRAYDDDENPAVEVASLHDGNKITWYRVG